MISLTPVASFNWLLDMPNFLVFPQKSRSISRAILVDHPRDSLCSRGKVK